MMRRSRFSGVAIALALGVLGVAGCGGSGSGDSGGTNVKLVYRVVSPKHDEFVKWLVDTFNKQHAGKIHVTYTGIPDNDYKTKIGLVMKGDSPPDVFFSWEGGWARSMISSGFAAPLDKYYAKYGWSKVLTPAADKLASLEGHKYFVPFLMSASVVWYNAALYKKYGLTVPKTWQELERNASVLKSHGVAPFLLANQQQWEAQFDWTAYFVNKNGVKVYDDLLARRIPWTDPRVIDAFNQMKALNDNGWFLKGVNSMDFDTTAIIFWKKQAAANWYQGSFILSKFLDSDSKLTSPVDWFPYPQIGNQRPTISVFAENTWMINKKSQHKDAAAQLLDFLISKEAQQKMVDMDGPYPANRSVSVTGMPPMIQRLGDTIAQYKSSTFMHVDHALEPGISQPYLEQLQGVLAGSVTPQMAAAVTERAAARTAGG